MYIKLRWEVGSVILSVDVEMAMCIDKPCNLFCGLTVLVVEEGELFVHLRETAYHFETGEEFPTTVGVKLTLAEWRVLEKYRQQMVTNMKRNLPWDVILSNGAFASTYNHEVKITKDRDDPPDGEDSFDQISICFNHWRALNDRWEDVNRLIDETTHLP